MTVRRPPGYPQFGLIVKRRGGYAQQQKSRKPNSKRIGRFGLSALGDYSLLIQREVVRDAVLGGKPYNLRVARSSF